MEYTRIEGIDLEVSRIGLGTWAIGGWLWGGTDDEQAVRTIEAAVDEHGITLIDTAPVYGAGHSEELVGRALGEAGRRERVIVATKVGLEIGNKPKRNSSRAQIEREIDDSLRRLKTDRIDIYQVHWPDESVPFEETAEALERLRSAGKIRAIGVSNYAPEQMEHFRATAPLHTAQPPYNLFERGIEQDVLPYCRDHGITTLMYGPLCRGLLTGRMRPDTTFSGDDLRKLDPKFQSPRYQQYLAAVDELDRFAREQYSKRVIHLAVRWLLEQPGASVALWGARRPQQLEPVAQTIDWHIDDEGLREIDHIVAKNVQEPVGPGFMAPPPRR